MPKIGDLLQAEADRRGFSHQAAGEACGVRQATFSRWVNSENPPSPEHITAIARFLRRPRDEVAKLVNAERDARRHRSVASRLDSIEDRLKRIESALEAHR